MNSSFGIPLVLLAVATIFWIIFWRQQKDSSGGFMLMLTPIWPILGIYFLYKLLKDQIT